MQLSCFLCVYTLTLCTGSPFLPHCCLIACGLTVDKPASLKTSSHFQLLKMWYELDEKKQRKYLKKTNKCPDPSLGVWRPDTYFASVSETFEKGVEGYIHKWESENSRSYVHPALSSDR